jgi:hypothetical protein
MNYWVTAFPCLMYLATIGTSRVLRKLTVMFSANIAGTVTGILDKEGPNWFVSAVEIPYYSISLSLNVLLTLMIIARLALHSRNIRNAIGVSSGPGGLYTAIITMLVESSALNAIGYLLSIIPDALDSDITYIFSPLLGHMQVRSVFAISRYTAIVQSLNPTGHLCVPHRSTSRKSNCIDERGCCLRGHWIDSFQERRGFYRWTREFEWRDFRPARCRG